MKVAICDDDIFFTKHLVKNVKEIFVSRHTPIEIETFSQGEALIKCFIDKKYFDLVLLDIDMPNIDGKKVANELRKFDNNFALIFVSSFEKEVYNTFTYRISSFIPKDKLDKLLDPELNRIISLIEETKRANISLEIYDVDDKRQKILIPLKSIIYLESQNRSIILYTINGKFTLTSTHFEKTKEKLLPLGLVEIHRTCIVNPCYIFSINSNNVELDTGQTLTLSRRKRETIISAVSNIAKEVV